MYIRLSHHREIWKVKEVHEYIVWKLEEMINIVLDYLNITRSGM